MKNKTGFIRKTNVIVSAGIELPRFVGNLSKESEAQMRGVTKMLMEPGKGILAVDESVSSINSYLRSMKFSETDNSRSKYLEVLLKSLKDTRHFLCGLLVRELMGKLKFQRGRGLASLLQELNVHLGIRADKGYVKQAGTLGEWLTSGLDTFEEDCRKFKEMGVSFVLWRALFKVTWCTPSQTSLTSNSADLAKFASLSHKAGLVPILSVELLPDGDYDHEDACSALKNILVAVVKSLHDYHIYMEGIIIRLTPTFPGQDCLSKCDLKSVVQSTLQICNRSIPPAVGGIMLARRESLSESVEILNELNKFPMKKPQPINFCFSRVIYDDVMKIWAGQEANLEKAKEELFKRTKLCSLGSMGQCSDSNGSLFLSKISNK